MLDGGPRMEDGRRVGSLAGSRSHVAWHAHTKGIHTIKGKPHQRAWQVPSLPLWLKCCT